MMLRKPRARANPNLVFLAGLGVGDLVGLAVEHVLPRQQEVRNWHRKGILQDLIGFWRGRRKCRQMRDAIDEEKHGPESAHQAFGAGRNRVEHWLHV